MCRQLGQGFRGEMRPDGEILQGSTKLITDLLIDGIDHLLTGKHGKPLVSPVFFSAAERCAQIINGKSLWQKGGLLCTGKILFAKDHARSGIEVVLGSAIAAHPDDKAGG